MVPSMDYTREHVKICFNSIINVEHDLYLIFGEEFKKKFRFAKKYANKNEVIKLLSTFCPPPSFKDKGGGGGA